MSAKDGGAAFPGDGARDPNSRAGSYTQPNPGMTMRDYFAAKALGEAFRFRQPSQGVGGSSLEYVAKTAYRIADAMLAERAR